jgi:shikimate dehydrogenase
MKLGLVGKFISHSLSPKIYENFFKEHNISGQYDLLICEDLLSFDPYVSYDGFNITQPFKEKAALLCDELIDFAKETGIVNTIIHTDSRYIGANTDAMAFVENLPKEIPDQVLIFGYGGVGKMCKGILKMKGCSSITIAERNPKSYSISWEKGLQSIGDFPLIIQASSCLDWPTNLSFSKDQYVIDWYYKNESFSNLAANTSLVKGITLLQRQAWHSFSYWKNAQSIS